MSKIIQAINAMISNNKNISDVIKSSGDEFYFSYKSKYIWSLIRGSDDNFVLFYYPSAESTEHARTSCTWDINSLPMVRYSSDDYKAREAKESFVAIYTILSEKVHGVDEVLADIISDDDF